MLTQLGHDVVAVSGKPEKEAFLKSLGAQSMISREEASDGGGKRPMLKERWAGVVDTVGGDILAAALKSLRYGASAAICGMVQSRGSSYQRLPLHPPRHLASRRRFRRTSSRH